MKERWVNGFDDWRYDDYLGCWYRKGNFFGYWCLGDRMFHEAYGRTRGDRCYHGSYTDNWHGGIQTRSFPDALEWLYGAKEEGHELW